MAYDDYGVMTDKSIELRKIHKFRKYNIQYKPPYEIIKLQMQLTAVLDVQQQNKWHHRIS